MEKHFAAFKFSQVVCVFLDHPSIFHGTKKKKNVNVAPFGLGNPAVAANPSTVCNPTDVFTWRIPKLVERKQVLATSFGATAEFQQLCIYYQSRCAASLPRRHGCPHSGDGKTKVQN